MCPAACLAAMPGAELMCFSCAHDTNTCTTLWAGRYVVQPTKLACVHLCSQAAHHCGRHEARLLAYSAERAG